MSPPSKVELYTAIRRDARAGLSGRALERKYNVGRRTVVKALTSGMARTAEEATTSPLKAGPVQAGDRRNPAWTWTELPVGELVGVAVCPVQGSDVWFRRRLGLGWPQRGLGSAQEVAWWLLAQGGRRPGQVAFRDCR
jgi:hypothetical protein